MILKIHSQFYNAINYFIAENCITISEQFKTYRLDINDNTPIYENGKLIHGENNTGISSLFE
jgi:hypothetical protein